MNIPISTAKAMREMVGAEQIVIVAVRDGATCVATHGLTERDADEAAKGGNALKKYLGWPAEKCDTKPLRRVCENCAFYKPDYGTWCFNGWSGDGSQGHCLVEPAVSRVGKEHGCRHFEPKN
jgi:hypothetical protein